MWRCVSQNNSWKMFKKTITYLSFSTSAVLPQRQMFSGGSCNLHNFLPYKLLTIVSIASPQHAISALYHCSQFTNIDDDWKPVEKSALILSAFLQANFDLDQPGEATQSIYGKISILISIHLWDFFPGKICSSLFYSKKYLTINAIQF